MTNKEYKERKFILHPMIISVELILSKFEEKKENLSLTDVYLISFLMDLIYEDLVKMSENINNINLNFKYGDRIMNTVILNYINFEKKRPEEHFNEEKKDFYRYFAFEINNIVEQMNYHKKYEELDMICINLLIFLTVWFKEKINQY